MIVDAELNTVFILIEDVKVRRLRRENCLALSLLK